MTLKPQRLGRYDDRVACRSYGTCRMNSLGCRNRIKEFVQNLPLCVRVAAKSRD